MKETARPWSLLRIVSKRRGLASCLVLLAVLGVARGQIEVDYEQEWNRLYLARCDESLHHQRWSKNDAWVRHRADMLATVAR
jgi:hypothetical protein